jgi:CRP-like cAMP-binding protein
MVVADGVIPRLRRVFKPAMTGRGALQAQLPYKREFLRKIEIFRDLSPAEMQRVEDMTLMTTVTKGRVIYHQEDTAEGLFLLKKGRVRLTRITPSGKKLELEVLEPGTFFGEMPLLGERMRKAQAEALEDCTLCVMSQADIERLVLDKPQVAVRMLEVVGRRLSDSESRLEELAYRSVPARLAATLLRLGRAHGDLIEGISHQELADMIGAYRETTTKILDEFRAAGYVELGRRRIQIRDVAGLSAQLAE